MNTQSPQPIYYISEEEPGHFYVYRLQYATVETLFDVAYSRADAEKAIEEHKAGTHPTQYEPPRNRKT